VGIWSGHLIKDDAGVPTIFYTAVDGIKAGIGSATSTDNLSTWQRNTSNPLIPAAPVAYPNKDFRDPYVFKEGSYWYMIIGTGLQSPQAGTVFLYRSTDLLSWQLLGPMFIDESFLNDPGVFWEMPVFWKFGSKYMLLVNKVPVPGTPAKAFYWVGDFDGGKFIPSNPRSQNLEIINSLLSPAVNVDDQNRVTAIGIIPDLLPGSEQYENGWANIFSLPRVWQMINDTLHQSPHPNLEKTRGSATVINNVTMQPSGSNYLNVRGWQMEIKANINPGAATQAGFIVGQNDTKTEFTKIWYDYQNQRMIVDRTKSSANSNTPRDSQSEVFNLPAGQPVEWHLFIDGSVIEVFINNRWAFATRIYPTDNSSNKVDMFSMGGSATASAIQIWNRGNLVTGIFDPASEYIQTKAWPVPVAEKCYIQMPGNVTGTIHLQFYDVAGRLVRQIKQQVTNSVKYIEWNLHGDNGAKVPAGNYYCTLTVNNTAFYQAKLLVINK
jgi:beta-fructofuranosidase